MDMNLFFDRLIAVLEAQDRKQAFFDLCELCRQADAEQRDFLRSEWPFEREWFVPIRQALLLSDSFSSEQRLRAALIRQALVKEVRDWRDVFVALCAIYHTAVRLGLDPDQLFEETARLSEETMADLLRSFSRCSPEDKSLKAYCYQEESTPEGIYLAGWGTNAGHRYYHIPVREKDSPSEVKKIIRLYQNRKAGATPLEQ